MNGERLWQRIDINVVENPPARLEEDDDCYYAREYISGGGYQASLANDLISNLQKPRSTENTQQWQYKIGAAHQFARELSGVIPDAATVACIPSSKQLDDPQYDPRLDMTMRELSRIKSSVIVERPIVRRRSGTPLHEGAARSVDGIYRRLEWAGFKNVPPYLILIDDVITTGSTFKACQRHVHENHPGLPVIGLFWCRVIWVD